MRWIIGMCLLAVVLAGCGDGDEDSRTIETRSPTTQDAVEWLDQYEPFTKVVTEEGQKVGLMEDDGALYTYDCELARKLTESGGAYGPKDGKAGYGSVCGSE